MIVKRALPWLLLLAAGCASSDEPKKTDGGQPMKQEGVRAGGAKAEFDKPGFVTKVEDGRLWVFREGSKELAAFQKHGELAKHVVRPGAGPKGMTMKAPDSETILAYLACKPGFWTKIDDGRIWVFREGSKELDSFQKHGELAKHVVRPGVGPGGATVKAPDSDTLVQWLAWKPGFVTRVQDGRIWVFKPGSKELEAFEKHGELAKHVVRPNAGPGGTTVKAPDAATIDEYIAAK
jgi:sugar lactone lactonase YvrE